MKKIFEKIVEGILTCSGFVTSITILLIVLFLFTEAFGLFGSKVIEEGYVLALNKENKVNQLSPAQIKDVFDEEITNWEELGGENLPIRVFRLGISPGIIRKKNWGMLINMPGHVLRNWLKRLRELLLLFRSSLSPNRNRCILSKTIRFL